MNETRSAVLAAYARHELNSAIPVGWIPPETSSTTLPGFTIALYDALSSVEDVWHRFEADADCTVFQDYDYLAIWEKHVGKREHSRPVIVVVRRAGEVSAIFPLAISGRILRRLTWLGQSLSDYLAPLLAPDFDQSVEPRQFAGLWREICLLMQRDPRFRHDLVDLRKMPEVVGKQANPFLTLTPSLHPSSAHVATLLGSWDSFYAAKRSGVKRKRDRNSRKRLEESGEVRMVTPVKDADLVQTLKGLIRQKAATFKRMGVSDLFARPGVQDFYLDLATNPHTRDLVHVSRLDVGPTMASAALGLQFRNRYHYILASYEDGAISRFSPGTTHLRDLMANAIKRGFREFDFTIGDERYKFEWADTEIKLYDLLAAASLRGLPAALFDRAFMRLKRTIKKTPVLWNAFQRIRALRSGGREAAQD